VAPGLSHLAAGALVLLAAVIAPISEEFFFRGVLFRTVRDRHGFWPAALASAIPFGLVHYVPSPAIDALVQQVSAPVRWEEVIQRLASEGVTTYVEVGPGTVLSGLVKKIHKDAHITHFGSPGDLAAVVAACSISTGK
jgi:membrane protease YdiL (CAAX protease family)